MFFNCFYVSSSILWQIRMMINTLNNMCCLCSVHVSKGGSRTIYLGGIAPPVSPFFLSSHALHPNPIPLNPVSLWERDDASIVRVGNVVNFKGGSRARRTEWPLSTPMTKGRGWLWLRETVFLGHGCKLTLNWLTLFIVCFLFLAYFLLAWKDSSPKWPILCVRLLTLSCTCGKITNE